MSSKEPHNTKSQDNRKTIKVKIFHCVERSFTDEREIPKSLLKRKMQISKV